MVADLKTLMEDIARAIRLKTGNSDKINAQDFPQKIREIPQGESSSFFIDIVQADEIKITPEIKPDVNVKLSLEGMKAKIIGENIQNTIINEQIKSTGTQYIDIGYTPNENTRLIITLSDVISPTGSNNNILFSATDIWDYNIFCLTYQTSGFRWMASNTHFKSGQHSPKATIELYRDFIKYNDEIVQELNSKGYNYKNLTTLRLFGGIRFKDQYAYTQGYTLYSLQIYENDILLYDLIPCLSNENNHLNEAALFDKISQQYFYNQGTGEFEYEKEVFIGVPVGSLIEVVSDEFDVDSCDIQWRDTREKLDCIIGSGTQYIDTNIIAKKNYRIEIEYKYITVYDNTWFFGTGMSFEAGYSKGLYTGAGFSYSTLSNGHDLAKGICPSDQSKTSYLLGRNWSGEIRPANMKIYNCKTYDEIGNLIQELIPAISTEPEYLNQVCMYDTVTKSYFYNKGSGDFSMEKISSFEAIPGAVTKTYIVENSNNILSCELTGKNDYFGQTVTDPIEVIENANDINE